MGRTRARMRAGAFVAMAVTAAGVVVPALPAHAAPTPVVFAVELDRTSIRADGRDTATVDVDATVNGNPLVGVTIRLTATWPTLPTTGGTKFNTAPFVLDANGHVTATLTSKRSGTMTIKASIGSYAYSGSATVTLDARRRSVVVFASGASSVVTCPTPTTCGDPVGIFNPVRSALAAQGFTPGDMPTFSYAGGTIDPLTFEWVPFASTCANSALTYKTQIGRMRAMLRKIAAANPNSDLTLVGLSQGGLLAFQMLAAQSPTLPKGSRLVNVITLDGAIGGVPLAQILNLENYGTSCFSLGGTSKAAQQLVATWNTTTPTQGPQQADNATVMCNVVGFLPCATPLTNQQVVAAASSVNVETWGSSQDGAFDPSVCAIPGTWVDARDTQVVTGAGGGMNPEGSASPGPFCVLGSHVAVVANRAPAIAATVGPQQ